LIPPVLSIVGRSNSGKTTLMCELVHALKKKGYRVGTLKHNAHGFDIDQPGKDTWKHREAGADVVMISSSSKVALIEKVQEELSLDNLLKRFEGVDLVITEGYKRENKPKIEVVRGSNPPVCREKEDNVLAFVGDTGHINTKKASTYCWQQIEELIEFIEKKIIGGV